MSTSRTMQLEILKLTQFLFYNFVSNARIELAQFDLPWEESVKHFDLLPDMNNSI